MGTNEIAYGLRVPLTADSVESPIVNYGGELDGRVGTDWILTRRVRGDSGKTFLRNYFGNKVATFDDTPSLSAIRPTIVKWLAEVSKRRKDMGKE